MRNYLLNIIDDLEVAFLLLHVPTVFARLFAKMTVFLVFAAFVALVLWASFSVQHTI